MEKLYKIPSTAKAIPIGQKPKRGAPQKTKKALQRQEPLPLSIDAVENVMPSCSNVASNPIASVAPVASVAYLIPPSKSVLKRKPVEEVPEVRRSARTKKTKVA